MWLNSDSSTTSSLHTEVLVDLDGSGLGNLGFLCRISHRILPNPPVQQDMELTSQKNSHGADSVSFCKRSLALTIACLYAACLLVHCLGYDHLFHFIISCLCDHCSTTNRAIKLKRQQVLPLKPGNLPVQITKNNLLKIQDAPALATDWPLSYHRCIPENSHNSQSAHVHAWR